MNRVMLIGKLTTAPVQKGETLWLSLAVTDREQVDNVWQDRVTACPIAVGGSRAKGLLKLDNPLTEGSRIGIDGYLERMGDKMFVRAFGVELLGGGMMQAAKPAANGQHVDDEIPF